MQLVVWCCLCSITAVGNSRETVRQTIQRDSVTLPHTFWNNYASLPHSSPAWRYRPTKDRFSHSPRTLLKLLAGTSAFSDNTPSFFVFVGADRRVGRKPQSSRQLLLQAPQGTSPSDELWRVEGQVLLWKERVCCSDTCHHPRHICDWLHNRLPECAPRLPTTVLVLAHTVVVFFT